MSYKLPSSHRFRFTGPWSCPSTGDRISAGCLNRHHTLTNSCNACSTPHTIREKAEGMGLWEGLTRGAKALFGVRTTVEATSTKEIREFPKCRRH